MRDRGLSFLDSSRHFLMEVANLMSYWVSRVSRKLMTFFEDTLLALATVIGTVLLIGFSAIKSENNTL